MKLYPHKYFSNTIKCVLASHVYNFSVELSSDFTCNANLDTEKNLIANERPLLLYDNKFISSTKAICLLFHRLRTNNTSLDERFNLYLRWIEWSDLFEKNVKLLNKRSIIKSLDELEHYLNKNKGTYFICNIGEDNAFSLADVFVYVSLKHFNIKMCTDSWVNINNYIEHINKLEDVQKVIKNVEEIYEFKNIYSLFISKICDKNLNEYLTKETFYITTAINYLNGDPHIGHAYEVILADVIARYHRNLGRQVFFTSGADEHGMKIANQAKKNNLTPQQLCDQNVLKFQKLNELLHISLDYYVRTTSTTHKNLVQKLWDICEKNGDIYLGEYEGWYNIREEKYVPENEAKLMNYIDPLNNLKLEKMKEPSYFFRMSKYQDRLIEHINNNPHFIQPEQKRNEILQRLKEPLNDLSCSRTNFTWGIVVPNDPQHVMYVWMDALFNYYTNCFIDDEKKNFWPADVHLIGKDITWFHAVIFPTLLMSTNLELPKCILSHGFVLTDDGKKMSKSLGNVIDPIEIIDKYGSDAFRFHMIKETKKGCDMRYDINNLIDICNSDLADTIGNLVQRTLALCQSSNDSRIPPFFPEYNIESPVDLLHFINSVEYHIRDYSIQICELIVNFCKDLNKFLTDLAPWKYKQEKKNKKLHIIRITLEYIYFIAHYLDIFTPTLSSNIFQKLNTPPQKIANLSPWLNNLKEGVIINNEGILFKKIEVITAKIKVQRANLRVCKIVSIIKNTESNKETICDIEVDQDKYTAILHLPQNSGIVNTLTVALLNIKPITISNITVHAVIPHVNKEIFNFSLSEGIHTGALIQAHKYPPVVNQRVNLTKREVDSLNLSIVNNNCFFENNIPLVFASLNEKPLHHPSQSDGPVVFF